VNRPEWFKRLDVSRCEEYFAIVEAFALKSGRHDQFMEKLKQLCCGDKADGELSSFGTPIDDLQVCLHTDFASMSFAFSVVIRPRGSGEWQPLYHGGLIFHGPHDNGGDGGAPTYSVNLTPQDGWSIHT